ncbi:hypothetical protein M440DRAFT_1406836 [Trichoderma longibrachiatum ATCC 18648]|uniref:DUF7924 domain-containing protein n=1 Tax=Trichoderma longibrachiatum ATCC 18648 TaxID=983965 RepID=A0A2T4BP43_TRILO|nr:hypothetical protein M440DRAFT_1406836 [Trichoderma longibrachiatum ATCC 18648]
MHSTGHAAEADPGPKRQLTSPRQPIEGASGELEIIGAHQRLDPVAFWAKEGRWPETSMIAFTMDCRLFARRKKSSSSLSRKRSNSATSTTPSDQKPREQKSLPYEDERYPLLLQIKGSYMGMSELGITDGSKQLIRRVSNHEQSTPQGTLFDDETFIDACCNLENKNKARIIQDVSRLLVPSAESLALRNEDYKRLVESASEEWNNSITLTGARPQPDYSIGFKRDAFTKDQLDKLSPFIGDLFSGDQSFFMPTYYMYFPFLTCEAQCGAAGLDIADRQNAHSMTLAVRGIVELFRAVKRDDEVNRKILAFSVSHDQRSVRIYGHYPVIHGEDIKYYRHPIHAFDFTAYDGRDKWTAYRFIKSVYDVWMPTHFEGICSAVDQLPSDLNFDVPSLSQDTGLSQDLGNLLQSDASCAPLPDGREAGLAMPSSKLSL